jgi:hypothetical protein
MSAVRFLTNEMQWIYEQTAFAVDISHVLFFAMPIALALGSLQRKLIALNCA